MLKYKKKTGFFGKRRLSTGLLVALEIFAVVIGIMLGFLVNEWRENRNNQKIAENALESIASEFLYNHERMVNSYEYYMFIVDQIDSLHQAGEPVRDLYGGQLDGWRGAMPPMLRSSAYQMVLSTGIYKDIPFETANRLAFVYNLQSFIEKLDDASIVNFTQDSGFTRLENIRHMFGLYSELIPSVIGLYQLLGMEELSGYGYDIQLTEGRLKEAAELQVQDFSIE